MNFISQYKSKLLALCFLISIPILDVTYFVLNNTDRGIHNVNTILDYSLPFLKIFVIPYVIWYPFILLAFVYLCFKNTKIYFRTLISLDISLILCYIIFYFFQTTMPRPDLVGSDFLTSIIRAIYSFDQPYNCFPSIHVLACYIIMRGIDKCQPGINKLKISAGVISTLIVLSTLFIKQHAIMDVLSAVLIGEVVFSIVKNLNLDRLVEFLQGNKVTDEELI